MNNAETRPECDQFPTGRNRWKICQGLAPLPLSIINAYRAKWGMDDIENPPDIERGRPQVHSGKTPPPHSTLTTLPKTVPVEVAKDGVGDQFAKLAKAQGAPSCQMCNVLRDKMNAWGVAGCRTQFAYIVADMFPRVRAWVIQEKPWARPFMIDDADAVTVTGLKVKVSEAADSKIRIEIRKMLTTAIHLAEVAADQTEQKKKSHSAAASRKTESLLSAAATNE